MQSGSRQTKRMIEVCCAIIRKGSQILAVQRGPGSSHPWQWEFPGGKMELNETTEQCIVREVEEELCIQIKPINRLLPLEFDYGIKQIRLIPLVCEIISGEITLTEHLALRWVDYGELETLDWSGADRELIRINKENLSLLL